jgi:glycosyltransferase involved in cell wall biosynthesis
MACATPVVAVYEGGVRESVLHQKTGLLTARDPHQFAHAVQAILTDPELAMKYGAQARVCVENNGRWERTVVEIEEQLKGTIAEMKSKPEEA